MTLALSNPSLDISNLIICDVAPGLAAPSIPIIQYLDTMSEIEDPANGIKTRKQAGKALEAIEKVVFSPCVLHVNSDLFPNTGPNNKPSSTQQCHASRSS